MRESFSVLFLFALRSSRPLLWVAVLLPYIGGAVLSHAPLSVGFWVVFIFLTWPYNFVLYVVNDYFDRDTDAINPRKTESGLFAGLKPSNVLVRIGPRMVYVVLCLSTLLFLLLPGISALCLVVLLGAAIVYSAPPLRLKEKPPLDSSVNGFLYFALPFLLGWSMSGGLQGVPWLRLWGLVVSTAGFHILASSIDYTADKRAGVRTITTVLGFRVALALAAGCVVLGLPAARGYPAAELFLVLALVCVGIVFIRPSEQLGRKLGYFCIYPGFIVATILCILQVLGKF